MKIPRFAKLWDKFIKLFKNEKIYDIIEKVYQIRKLK